MFSRILCPNYAYAMDTSVAWHLHVLAIELRATDASRYPP